MAQFDSLIIFVLISSLFIVLIFHYDIIIEVILPCITEIKKCSEKKLLDSF